ncbi:hypothetical protein, conserved [Eimeria tenella]|uniref:Uncharacterized protein n=1 Tax=Eimeria tenella TaxID=5802 RepID=U6KPH7_EIMTE|nr:hypothetical protein, conserved [Eimeria tenella]CDJ38202.1 hypothetical protein, conserved [Eimeria tenella]|eukprot:XP_013229040.1 hypothetical protein, conserved [Eimeria tenella]
MGATELWKAIRNEAAKKTSLCCFRHRRLAVDIAGWIDRAIRPVALQLLQEQQQLNSRAAAAAAAAAASPSGLSHSDLPSSLLSLFAAAWTSIGQQLSLLQQAEIEPIFVFEGAPLKAKEEKQRKRKQFAAAAAAAAVRLQAAGNAAGALHAARAAAANLIVFDLFRIFVQQKLKCLGCTYIVAPYEAKAQIAQLAAAGVAAAAVSDDMELLAYGCTQLLSGVRADGSASLISFSFFNSSKSLSLQQQNWSVRTLQVARCLLSFEAATNKKGKFNLKDAIALIDKHGDLEAIERGLCAAESDRHKSRCTYTSASGTQKLLLAYRHQTVFAFDESVRKKGK